MMQRSPTCPNCWKNFEFTDFRPIGKHIPLVLNCGHTFCDGCLFKLARQKDEIACPTCSEPTKLDIFGEKGVNHLTPDIYILGVLTYNRRIALGSSSGRIPAHPALHFGGVRRLSTKSEDDQKREDNIPTDSNEESKTEVVPCGECNQPATCLCKNCDYSKMCDSCFDKIHKSTKILNKHKPLPLSFPEESELECKDHWGRPLEFYDKNLNQAVCSHCIISDKCKGHDIVPMSDLDASFKEELNNSLSAAKETLSWLNMSHKVITSAMPECSMEATQLLENIRTYFMSLHTSLQAREMKLLDETSEKFAQSSSLDSMFIDISNKMNDVRKILSDYEIMAQHPQALRYRSQEVISKLDAFKDIKCFAVRDNDESDRIRFNKDEAPFSYIKEVGQVDISDTKLISLKKPSELSEDELNLAKAGNVPDEIVSRIAVQENEILDENIFAPKVKHKTYDAQSLSMLKSSFELVYVTHVKAPTDFKVQRCADKERLQVMMQALNKYCRQSDNKDDLVFTAEEGDVVCGQFLTDNHWYRARITSAKPHMQPNVKATWENGLPVEVLYIDYGNSERLPLARLRKIKPAFLEVPELAVPCSLVDIVPPAQQEKWPPKTIKAFNSLVGERPLLMNIRFRLDGKLYVDLKRPDDDEPTQDDDERPISVRDALVFLEVARFVSPSSVPNVDLRKPTRTFKEPKLPQPGDFLDIIVTFVNDPDNIYVQKYDSSVGDIHEELGKLYSGRGSREAWKIPFPYRNLVCAAKFSEDRLWYRALITAVRDDSKVDLTYVDYGNSETRPFTEIKKLPDSCLVLPKQAVIVKLKDLGKLEGQDVWSAECKKALSRAIMNKALVLISRDLEDGIPCVELCDTSTNEDIYISRFLVERELAMSTGPCSEIKEKPISEKQNEQAPSQDCDDLIDLADEQSEVSSEVGEKAKCADDKESYFPTFLSQPEFVALGIFVDEDSFIYAHEVKEEDKLLGFIMAELNTGSLVSIADEPPPTNSSVLHPGQPCIAQFSEDGLWYRACINEIIDNKRIQIEYVDFGNKEVTTVKNLRLKACFLDVPKQALKLKIEDLVPNTPDGKWAGRAIQALTQAVVNQKFEAKVLLPQEDPNIFRVHITHPKGGELGQRLINAGFAKHADVVVVMDEQVEQKQAPAPQIKRFPLVDLASTQGKYVQPALPGIGIQFDVTVTQVESPDTIYIQRCPCSDDGDAYSTDDDETLDAAKDEAQDLSRLSVLLNSDGFFDDNSTLDMIHKEMPCCAQYTADDQWYRAYVKNVGTNDDNVIQAHVVYIDYGTSEWLSIDRLRSIPSDFLELPSQGIYCKLAGFQPPEKATRPFYRGTKWPIETMRILYRTVANKKMIACVMSYGPPVSVILYDRCLADGTDETFDVSVGRLLQDDGLVSYTLQNLIGGQKREKDNKEKDDGSKEKEEAESKPEDEAGSKPENTTKGDEDVPDSNAERPAAASRTRILDLLGSSDEEL